MSAVDLHTESLGAPVDRMEWAIHGTRTPDQAEHYFKPIAQTVLYLPAGAWALIDVALGVVAFLFAHWASPAFHEDTFIPYHPLGMGLVFGVTMAAARHILDTHNFVPLTSITRSLGTSAGASGASLVLMKLVTTWFEP
jgi:hypothetical protein